MERYILVPKEIPILTTTGFKRINNLSPSDLVIGIEKGKLEIFRINSMPNEWIKCSGFNVYTNYSWTILSEDNFLFTSSRKININNLYQSKEKTRVELLYECSRIKNFMDTDNNMDPINLFFLGFLRKSLLFLKGNYMICRIFNNQLKKDIATISGITGEIEASSTDNHIWYKIEKPKFLSEFNETSHLAKYMDELISKTNIENLLIFYLGYLVASSYTGKLNFLRNTNIIFSNENYDFSIISIIFRILDIPFQIVYYPSTNFSTIHLSVSEKISKFIPDKLSPLIKYITNDRVKKVDVLPFIKQITKRSVQCMRIGLETDISATLLFGNMLIS